MSAVDEARELIDRWFSAGINKLIESYESGTSSGSDTEKESSRDQSPEIVYQKLENSKDTENFPVKTEKHFDTSIEECEESEDDDDNDDDEPSLLSEEFETNSPIDCSDETCSQGSIDAKSSYENSVIFSPLKPCLQQNFVDKIEKRVKNEPSAEKVDEGVQKRLIERTKQEWNRMTPDIREYLNKVAKQHSEFHGEESFDENAPITLGLFTEIIEYAYTWNEYRLQKTMPPPPRCPVLADMPENFVIFFVKIIYARFGEEKSEEACA